MHENSLHMQTDFLHQFSNTYFHTPVLFRLTNILSESMIVFSRWAIVMTVHSVNFLRMACWIISSVLYISNRMLGVMKAPRVLMPRWRRKDMKLPVITAPVIPLPRGASSLAPKLWWRLCATASIGCGLAQFHHRFHSLACCTVEDHSWTTSLTAMDQTTVQSVKEVKDAVWLPGCARKNLFHF